MSDENRKPKISNSEKYKEKLELFPTLEDNIKTVTKLHKLLCIDNAVEIDHGMTVDEVIETYGSRVHRKYQSNLRLEIYNRLPHIVRRVLKTLQKYSKKEWEPNVHTLADDSDCGTRCVKQSTDILVALGWVHVYRGEKWYDRNRYWVIPCLGRVKKKPINKAPKKDPVSPDRDKTGKLAYANINYNTKDIHRDTDTQPTPAATPKNAKSGVVNDQYSRSYRKGARKIAELLASIWPNKAFGKICQLKFDHLYKWIYDNYGLNRGVEMLMKFKEAYLRRTGELKIDITTREFCAAFAALA